MIIKMVTEFMLTFVNFARPNQMQIRACAWIHRWTKKNCEKSRLGRQAAELPGRRGPRATGLLLAKP